MAGGHPLNEHEDKTEVVPREAQRVAQRTSNKLKNKHKIADENGCPEGNRPLVRFRTGADGIRRPQSKLLTGAPRRSDWT